MLSSKQRTAIIIAGIFVVGIFILYMVTKSKNYDYSIINEITEENIEEKQSDEKENIEEIEEMEEADEDEIMIHITGAVKNPGILKLKEGYRIAAAIELAGGLTDDADTTSINFAYKVKDGQKIYIPKISDTKEIVEAKNDETSFIIDDGEDNSINTNKKININTASQSQLMSLSGIGEGTAIKIIEYRTANGKFKSIEDIKNVSGIGNSKYESIKNYICVK